MSSPSSPTPLACRRKVVVDGLLYTAVFSTTERPKFPPSECLSLEESAWGRGKMKRRCLTWLISTRGHREGRGEADSKRRPGPSTCEPELRSTELVKKGSSPCETEHVRHYGYAINRAASPTASDNGSDTLHPKKGGATSPCVHHASGAERCSSSIVDFSCLFFFGALGGSETDGKLQQAVVSWVACGGNGIVMRFSSFENECRYILHATPWNEWFRPFGL